MERRYAVPYNWFEPAYSMRWAGKQGMADIVLSWIRPGMSLLDIGCGDGWYAARYVEAGAVVHGIDISARSVGFASLLVPSGRFLVGSATQLPYPDHSFDVVTCVQVLEHLTEEDVAQALAAFRRVVRPGGIVIISVPSTQRRLSAAHLRHYTPEMLRDALTPYGMVTEMVGQERHSRLTLGLRTLFENRFWRFPLMAKWFYTHIYFPRWNRVPVERANNIVCVLRI